jgi:hypothetical protein
MAFSLFWEFTQRKIDSSMLCVSVPTAWRVLGLRMEKRPPIWRVAANIRVLNLVVHRGTTGLYRSVICKLYLKYSLKWWILRDIGPGRNVNFCMQFFVVCLASQHRWPSVFMVVLSKHSGQWDTCNVGRRVGVCGIISAEATVNVFILLYGYFLVLCPSSCFLVDRTSWSFGSWFCFHLQVESRWRDPCSVAPFGRVSVVSWRPCCFHTK